MADLPASVSFLTPPVFPDRAKRNSRPALGLDQAVRARGDVRLRLRAPVRRETYFVDVRARDRAGNPALPPVLEAFSVR